MNYCFRVSEQIFCSSSTKNGPKMPKAGQHLWKSGINTALPSRQVTLLNKSIKACIDLRKTCFKAKRYTWSYVADFQKSPLYSVSLKVCSVLIPPIFLTKFECFDWNGMKYFKMLIFSIFHKRSYQNGKLQNAIIFERNEFWPSVKSLCFPAWRSLK